MVKKNRSMRRRSMRGGYPDGPVEPAAPSDGSSPLPGIPPSDNQVAPAPAPSSSWNPFSSSSSSSWNPFSSNPEDKIRENTETIAKLEKENIELSSQKGGKRSRRRRSRRSKRSRKH